MQFHKIIAMNDNVVSGLDFELPINSLGKNAWIGIAGYPDGRYTFAERGRYFGTYKLPMLTRGDEIHAGVKGDELKDRKRFQIVDLDATQILVRRLHDGK